MHWGSKRRLVLKQDTYQYVPLLSSLKSLLSDPSIFEQVEKLPLRVHRNSILEDICDGELFQNHQLFSKNPLALQITMFYDELELCNPLGTHVKWHKLAVFLFTLGNIEPKYRSSLRAIYLLIAATVPVIEKHGIDLVLDPLLKDLKILATEGINVVFNGIDRTLYSAVLVCLGDNLGSNTIGGFK